MNKYWIILYVFISIMISTTCAMLNIDKHFVDEFLSSTTGKGLMVNILVLGIFSLLYTPTLIILLKKFHYDSSEYTRFVRIKSRIDNPRYWMIDALKQGSLLMSCMLILMPIINLLVSAKFYDGLEVVAVFLTALTSLLTIDFAISIYKAISNWQLVWRIKDDNAK